MKKTVFGFPLTERKTGADGSILTSRQLRMLAVSVAVGVAAGLFMGNMRLHLGLPGHKAVLWMTPVLLTRLLGGCKAGGTAGALSAAFTALALGGRVAGGVLGLPFIGLAGAICDTIIDALEKRQDASCVLIVLFVGIAGVSANLLCLAKRLLLPAGPIPHNLLGLSGLWFEVVCYAFFGLISGLLAATVACLIGGRRSKRGMK